MWNGYLGQYMLHDELETGNIISMPLTLISTVYTSAGTNFHVYHPRTRSLDASVIAAWAALYSIKVLLPSYLARALDVLIHPGHRQPSSAAYSKMRILLKLTGIRSIVAVILFFEELRLKCSSVFTKSGPLPFSPTLGLFLSQLATYCTHMFVIYTDSLENGFTSLRIPPTLAPLLFVLWLRFSIE